MINNVREEKLKLSHKGHSQNPSQNTNDEEKRAYTHLGYTLASARRKYRQRTQSTFVSDLKKMIFSAFSKKSLKKLHEIDNYMIQLEYNATKQRNPKDIDDLFRLRIILENRIKNLERRYTIHVLTEFITYIENTKVQEAV